MTTDVETVVSETIEKVNEWLRNAVTKHGKTVYRPFVLEEPHYRYDSGFTVEDTRGEALRAPHDLLGQHLLEGRRGRGSG
jgi:hypothetical protein